MLKKSACAVAVVMMAVIAGGSAGAAPANMNALLTGDYAFSGNSTCIVSRGGFNANLSPLGPPAPFPFTDSFSVQGVRTFNGDGTGHLVGRVVSVTEPFTVPSATLSPYTPFFNRGNTNAADVEADFTYSVAADGTVTIESTSFTGIGVSGPGAGVTFSIPDFPPLVGQLSRDHAMLTVAHLEPAVETHYFSSGDVQYKVCHRARILFKK